MTNAEATTPTDGAIAPEQLVERARELIPIVRERAQQASEQRMLPPETLADFKEAGFIRAVQPIAFGGMAHDLEVIADVSMQIARGCGASGWLSSFIPLHQFMVGWFSEQAQQEYWGNGPETLSSTVPGYKATERVEVKGGLKLTGRASFSSGVDYSEWVLFHTPLETCLIPREDFEIEDDWFTAGLRGTGSKAVSVKDAFVPDHRIVTNQQLVDRTYPGAHLQDSAWYRVSNPLLTILNQFILAPVIGMARGVLEIFGERAQTRIDPQVFEPAFTRPGPQLRFAEASAELDAAEMFLRRNLEMVRDSGERNIDLTLAQRAELRRNVVYGDKLAVQAVNRLVDGMDSSALYDKNLLHRQALDFRAGSLQVIFHYEETAMQYSRVLWGMEPNTKLI